MKILFATNTMDSGGKERRLTELMKALKVNYDVEFELALMSNDIYYKEILDLDIKINYLIRRTKIDLTIFYKFYQLCKKSRPDIVHCWDSLTAVYLVPACKILDIRLVNGMVTNSPSKQNIFNKHWLRAKLTFPFSDLIIGNSYAGLKAYRVSSAKCHVVYNGFNFQRIKNLSGREIVKKEIAADSKFVIGMVATFYENKDYPTYFRAAQILLSQRDDVIFLAIGKDTDSPAAKSLIDEKYMKNFRLMGRVTGIENIINTLDIGVLATFTEGISNAVLEYMALGKPVIVTSGGGTDELVTNNSTGFLVRPSDPEELASKILMLLGDEQLRTNMGLAGKQQVLKNFSIDKMVSNYYNQYKSVLAN